jgi:diguanylate cyclase (GGDEF)-like protein
VDVSVRTRRRRHLRHEPYRVSIYVGLSLASAMSVGYGVVFLLLPRWGLSRPWPFMSNLVTGALCGFVAWLAYSKRLPTAAAQERGAMLCLFALVLTLSIALRVGELTPEMMTSVSIIYLVVGSSVMLSWYSLMAFWTGILANWLVFQIGDAEGQRLLPAWLSVWAVALCGSVAVFAIASIERRLSRRLLRATQKLAERDPLTGVLNRVGFAQQENFIAALARRRSEGLWLAFADVDHFKSVNDVLGHDAGDEVLACVGRAIVSTPRASDLAARWGGDEFVVLGIGEPPTEEQFEERLRGAMSGLSDRIQDAWEPGVTVGIARSNGDGDIQPTDEVAGLIASADMRMFARRQELRRLGR